jgi:hypothetical protein
MADGSELMGARTEAIGVADDGVAARPRPASGAFWVGVAALVTWLVPILGVPVAAVGLVLAARGRRAGAERWALAMAFSAIGLALSLVMWLAAALVVSHSG